VLKSKQQTVSWLTACCALWNIWTPMHRDWCDLMMSRSEALVDDGGENSTRDSLLGKVRFTYDRLPPLIKWPIDFSFNRITNQATGSVIKGKSTSTQSGRGSNCQDLWADEVDFMPKSELIASAIEDGAERKILVSSANPERAGGWFQRVEEHPADYVCLRMMWWDHPGKRCDCTSPLELDPARHRGCWYARECERRTQKNIASELNGLREGFASGRVFYTFSDEFVADDLAVLENLPIYRGWDLGVGDDTAVWFAQFVPIDTRNGARVLQLRLFDYYENRQMGAIHYRGVLQEKAREYPRHHIYDWADPHTLTARESDLSSWRTNLADGSHPYRIFAEPTGCVGVPVEVQCDATRAFMRYIEDQRGNIVPRMLVSGKRCGTGLKHLKAWGYATDETGRAIGHKPAHDAHSHAGTALNYLIWPVAPATEMPAEYGADAVAVAELKKEPVAWA